MNIVFVSKRTGRVTSWSLGRVNVVAIMASLTVSLVTAGWLGAEWQNQQAQADVDARQLQQMRADLVQQKEELSAVAQSTQREMDALTLRMGEMQARLLRLDALGLRLTDMADLEGSEFDFTSEPALGGPVEAEATESYSLAEVLGSLDQLEEKISDRMQQLDLLEEFLAKKSLDKDLFVAGRPIKDGQRGWLSSHYGYRTDPFNGKRAWHGGVDFAGNEGADIVSVAAGVVTFSGERHGYGNLVEISHGDGLVTRYAHCKEMLVSVGDVVEKGQTVALMGSTGRSTGPHVHFEVLRNGKTLNPKKYIHRASL